MNNRLILSIFPGIDLLGTAFESEGYCVVRGPDLLFGGDIRYFTPPDDVFWGIIGGPPCQDFSRLRRSDPTGYGLEMLSEFSRCVTEAAPEWWLLENVDRVPDVTLPGYVTQRFPIDNGWFPEAQSRRLRHIQFGSRSGRLLNVTPRRVTEKLPTAALANDNRSFHLVRHLQGLPDSFDLPGFTVAEKIRAVGNGVPLPMGLELAKAVKEAYRTPNPLDKGKLNTCLCGCGRSVPYGQKYALDAYGKTDACRKRRERQRKDNSRPGASHSHAGGAV